MTTTRQVLSDLNAIGARIEPVGDRLLVRAGPKPVPATVIRRIRQAKAELLAALQQNSAPLAIAPSFARLMTDELSLEKPCAARRDRVQEFDGALLHFCIQCGRFAAFGYGVRLRAGQFGRWYCGKHRPPLRNSG